jgi:hypothetical protein
MKQVAGPRSEADALCGLKNESKKSEKRISAVVFK